MHTDLNFSLDFLLKRKSCSFAYSISIVVIPFPSFIEGDEQGKRR